MAVNQRHTSAVVLLLGLIVNLASADVFVEINQGILRGKERVDRYGGEFFAFRSIPYAEPPIGSLRFMPPQPAQGWTGVRDATQDLPICYQGDNIGTEDCLYLNVFTRHLTPNRATVMVFIHGGGYVLGDAREELYNPEILLTKDVVLVTAGYRLGMLGFLSLGINDTQSVTANAGMKDQVMILEWVQANIANFGGNPGKVTLFGESAGSASVHLHLFSPLSAGLFHTVILESGTALVPWSIGKPGSGEALAKELGLTTTNSQEILLALQNLPASEILQAQQSLLGPVDIYRRVYSSPIVETNSAAQNFLPVHPRTLLETKNYTSVPILIGYNDKEGIFLDIFNKLNGEYLHLYDLENLIPHDLRLDGNQQAISEIVTLLQDFYFDGLKPVPEVDALKLIDAMTDSWFLYGILNTVRKHLENEDKIWFYKFSSDTKLNYYKRLLPQTALYEGACHVDELGYLFKTIYTPEYDQESIEDIMIEQMVLIWTSFALNQRPATSSNSLDWDQVHSTRAGPISYMHIKTGELAFEEDPESERMALWDHIYETYGNGEIYPDQE